MQSKTGEAHLKITKELIQKETQFTHIKLKTTTGTQLNNLHLFTDSNKIQTPQKINKLCDKNGLGSTLIISGIMIEITGKQITNNFCL